MADSDKSFGEPCLSVCLTYRMTWAVTRKVEQLQAEYTN